MANEQDVTRLIDMLYEKVEDAKAPALKPNMSMVDRDEILDLLDELRAQLPVELRRAKELLAAREKFVEDAKRDVDRMMRQAELEAKSKVSESEILSAAREKSRGMIAHAEERCRRMYQVTNEYTEDALARAVADCDILVNATRVGMKPLDGETLIDPALFRPELVVADTVYNPRETRMIQEAKAAGCRAAIGGIGMLLWQGVAAFKLFTGKDMPAQEVLEKFFS